MAPSITTALPPFPPTESLPLLLPTTPPNPLLPIILDKRQTYVTVSVMKNTTSSTDDTTAKKSGFPVAIAIPALVGGMALALAGFGIWFWWTRKVKRERRAAWEARQRRKRKRAEQSARPSVSSARANSASTTATGGGGGGQKSPINEKGFVPPVPALPKYAVQQGQDPFKERGYGYNNPSAGQQNMAPATGGGAFGYATQPGFETGGVTYGYDQYGQPIPQFDSSEKYGHDQTQSQGQQPHGYHRRSVSNDSSNPSNPFGSNAYPAEKQSVLASVSEPSHEHENEYEHEPEPESPTKEQQAPARTEKSSKRAQARMAVAESAAANASVDPAYRHQPKKPSPLALAAAQKKAAEAEAEARGTGMETLAPPGYGNDSHNNANRQVVSGEWGVALGSPNNDGQFDINRRPSQSQSQSQMQNAVRQESGRAPASAMGYNDDPYLQQQRAKSGQYTEDPYAAYHGGDEERAGAYDDGDDDVYHRAAEGMGLGGGRGGNAPKASRWV
ncbi:hypothetical protein IAT40_002779 [Kwoniella sp. CBS 6097]